MVNENGYMILHTVSLQVIGNYAFRGYYMVYLCFLTYKHEFLAMIEAVDIVDNN